MIKWLPQWIKRSRYWQRFSLRRQRIKHYQQLAASQLFDASWYCERYPDVAADKRWKQDPLLHYLSVGAAEGKNPGPAFDTRWYLRTYPDVRKAAINPLLHYVCSGRAEGRLPTMLATPSLIGAPDITLPAFLNARAWAGYAGYCIPLLKQLALEGNREAQWYLAAWFYGQGDFSQTLTYLEALVVEPLALTSRYGMALAKCYTLLGDVAGLQNVLQLPLAALQPQQSCLVQANLACLQQHRAEQLDAINHLFAAANLALLEAIEPADALTIQNITTAAVPAELGPLISVVIPAYNCAQTVGLALESLVNQSWQNLEIIVVDDASTDDTQAVVQKWRQRDERIHYLCNEQNLGAYASRNRGMQQARGSFVTVHDSDDWSHPQKLAQQVQPLLGDNRLQASFSYWVRVLPELLFVGPWCLNDTFLEKNYSSLLLRKSVLQKIGYWDPVFVAADGEFIQRLQCHFEPDSLVAVLPECPLSFGLVSADSLTQQSKFHVKSHCYGLRRLYRESYTCWHRRESAPVQPEHERAFPAPVGMLSKQPIQLDVLLLADLAAMPQHSLQQLAQLLQKYISEGKRCGIFHWPAFTDWPQREVTADVFELCHRFGVVLIEPDAQLEAQSVQLLQADLLSHYPDTFPYVTGLRQLLDDSGQAMPTPGKLRQLLCRVSPDNSYRD